MSTHTPCVRAAGLHSHRTRFIAPPLNWPRFQPRRTLSCCCRRRRATRRLLHRPRHPGVEGPTDCCRYGFIDGLVDAWDGPSSLRLMPSYAFSVALAEYYAGKAVAADSGTATGVHEAGARPDLDVLLINAIITFPLALVHLVKAMQDKVCMHACFEPSRLGAVNGTTQPGADALSVPGTFIAITTSATGSVTHHWCRSSVCILCIAPGVEWRWRRSFRCDGRRCGGGG